MNIKRVFGNLFFAGKAWNPKFLQTHWVSDQTGGIMYAGLTVCGFSLLYSDTW